MDWQTSWTNRAATFYQQQGGKPLRCKYWVSGSEFEVRLKGWWNTQPIRKEHEKPPDQWEASYFGEWQDCRTGDAFASKKWRLSVGLCGTLQSFVLRVMALTDKYYLCQHDCYKGGSLHYIKYIIFHYDTRIRSFWSYKRIIWNWHPF